jgi:hypothetical protein
VWGRGVEGGVWRVAARMSAIAIAVVIVGCGSEAPKTGGGSSTTALQPTPHTPPPQSECPADGLWHPCSITKRLEMSGFAPRKEEERVRERPLMAEGTRYALGQSSLIVFLYATESARITDQARLDTTGYIDPYESLSMRLEPSRIGSANLLAILRSRSDRQRARVADALTAGPPQGTGAKP